MSRSIESFNIEELALKLEFPPVKIKNWIADPIFTLKSEKMRLRSDYTAEIEWEDRLFKFVVEINPLGTPKKTHETVYKLEKYISAIETSETYHPLLIAPFLSEKALEYLISEKVSGLDLSGNGVIYVPGEMFVYRTGKENKFPSNAPIKNVYRGVSSLISRVFLAKPEYSAVGDVLNEIKERSGKTTFATVSKVLKSLEEELIISRNGGIRLIDEQKLLKNLRENYERPQVNRTVQGKAENLADALRKMSENSNENEILLAIDEPQRYAVMPTSGMAKRIYTENIEAIMREVDFSENERFPNLELIETQEPTVYFDRRWNLAEGAYFISPVQVYLELANGSKREKETAEQISKNILDFNYKA